MGWIIDLLKDVPLSTVIREQLVSAEKKIALLESENTNLQSQVRELRQEIQRRDDVIQKEKFHDNLLEKLKVDILIFLSVQKGAVTADEVARHLKINPQIAIHHLTELNKKSMILVSHRMNFPPFWNLADGGRKYLINNNLIS